MTIDAATYPIWQTSEAESKATTAKEKPLTPMSDHALAQLAAGGDLTAFEELYERHNRRVYSLCLRMTQNAAEAEDLAQEA
ncbi:MAG TPA: sigma factor, partial [Pyrinomonadaceae bacterium]